MKIVTNTVLAATLLSMGLATLAAQEPIQEPRSKAQWQDEGVAFSAIHHARLGAKSFASQLPQNVARDIVELIKPKEEYGFIKNFTDKQIAFLSFDDILNPQIMLYVSTAIIQRNTLAPNNQISFIVEANDGERAYGIERVLIRIYWTMILRTRWIPGLTDRLFDVYLQFQNESFVRKATNVHFSDLMNMKVYNEGQRIRLEVTSPYREPTNYYAEPVKRLW